MRAEDTAGSVAPQRTKGGYVVATGALGAAGTAGVAVLSSLCCAGPAVLAVLGTSGALAAAELAPYRPYFLAAAFVMLGFAFWRAYRPVPSGAACPVRTGRAVRGILWGALAVTAGAAILPFWLS
jgi:mercuric ion transport protein